jgi:putative flippase GtrA
VSTEGGRGSERLAGDHAPEQRFQWRHLIGSRVLELTRFVVTGVLSVAMNFIIIVSFTEYLRVNYLWSIATCFVIVTAVSFWLNRLWTFRKRNGTVAIDLSRYVSLTAIQYVSYAAGYALCVQVLHVPYRIAAIGLSVLVAPVTYLVHRRWSFGLKWLQHC